MYTLTSFFQKIFASAINASCALILSLPIFLHYGFRIQWRLTTILIFLLYELVLLFTKDKRDIGMIVVGSHWKQPFTPLQYVIYNIFYALSFATAFFYIVFPGDLLLCNLLLVQLPLIIFTKFTLHGYISKMTTIQSI